LRPLNNTSLKIGLLSDTHGYLDEAVFTHFDKCDEIWHAGDVGDVTIVQRLMEFKPLRGVYGNIDGQAIRSYFPENNFFMCEEVKVFLTHIGGYPPSYNNRTKPLIEINRPQLFISGHSHILKIKYDPKYACMHMNPGAAGKQGWHKVKTLIRFEINGLTIQNCEVIEIGTK